MEDKFNKVYEEVLKQNIEELTSPGEIKKIKKEMYSPIIFAFIIILSVFLFFLIGMVDNMRDTKYSILGIANIVLFPLLIIFSIFKISNATKYEKYEKYRKKFKQKVIKPMLESFNENLKYNSSDGISTSEYDEFKPEKYNTFISEDILEGKIKNIGVKIGEILTEVTVHNKEGDTEAKVFEGLFAKIEVSKSYETNIYIRKQFQQDLEKMKIEMDSGEFNRLFWTYSLDKNKAYEILTSDVMELITDLREKSKIEFDISIENNIIYIRFHTGEIKYQTEMSHRIRAGGLFEPEINNEIINKESLYNDFEIFYTCVDIINKLVNRLGIDNN